MGTGTSAKQTKRREIMKILKFIFNKMYTILGVAALITAGISLLLNNPLAESIGIAILGHVLLNMRLTEIVLEKLEENK